jgi:5-methylcytosine-specific restriction endonuclease McrA
MAAIDAIRIAAAALSAGNTEAAGTALTAGFGSVSATVKRGSWSKRRLVQVFLRDRFTDRYSGAPLVYPGALRAMSVLAPELVPFHANWRQSATHPAYWNLYPTLDHIIPVARGGTDDERNVVTTSMLRNSAKANWTLDELGWTIVSRRDRDAWDGILPWFCREFEAKERLQRVSALRGWYVAAKGAA